MSSLHAIKISLFSIDTRLKFDVDPKSIFIFPFSFCGVGVIFSKKFLISCVVIQVDIGGHPPIPTSSSSYFLVQDVLL
jgi:hypothetical protein